MLNIEILNKKSENKIKRIKLRLIIVLPAINAIGKIDSSRLKETFSCFFLANRLVGMSIIIQQ